MGHACLRVALAHAHKGSFHHAAHAVKRCLAHMSNHHISMFVITRACWQQPRMHMSSLACQDTAATVLQQTPFEVVHRVFVHRVSGNILTTCNILIAWSNLRGPRLSREQQAACTNTLASHSRQRIAIARACFSPKAGSNMYKHPARGPSQQVATYMQHSRPHTVYCCHRTEPRKANTSLELQQTRQQM